MSNIDTDEYAYRHYSLEDDPDPRPWEEYYRVYGLDYDGLCDHAYSCVCIKRVSNATPWSQVLHQVSVFSLSLPFPPLSLPLPLFHLSLSTRPALRLR